VDLFRTVELFGAVDLFRTVELFGAVELFSACVCLVLCT